MNKVQITVASLIVFILLGVFYGMGFSHGLRAKEKELARPSITTTNDVGDILNKLEEWQENVRSNKMYNLKHKKMWI